MKINLDEFPRSFFSLLLQISHVAVNVYSFIKSYLVSAPDAGAVGLEIRCIFWVSNNIPWMYVIFIVQSVKLPYLLIVGQAVSFDICTKGDHEHL